MIEFLDLSEWEKKPLSFSQYQTYSNCPESYWLKKLMVPRPPERPAAWTVHGNAYHSAAERWHLEGGNISSIYTEEFQKEEARQWEIQPDPSLWNLTPRVKEVKQDLKLRYANGQNQILAYKEDANSGDWYILEGPDGRPMVEEEFEVQLGGKTVRGIVDQIRQYPKHIEIVDLKTGSPRAGYQQLGIYRLAIAEKYGISVDWGRFFYSKLDRVPKSGDGLGRYSGYVGLDHLGRPYWDQQISDMVKGVRQGLRITSVSDSCERCDVRAWCSAWKEED